MTEKTKPSEGSLLRRWSRLKSEAREKENARPATGSVGAHAVPVTLHSGTDVAASRGEPPAAGPAQAPAVADAIPSLPPVESLTIDSDFAPFLQPKVDEALKRRALKQLFRDSHFNVMDGLDVYIDDYSKPDPIPPELIRELVQGRYIFDPPATRINAQGHVEDVPPEELAALEHDEGATTAAPPMDAPETSELPQAGPPGPVPSQLSLPEVEPSAALQSPEVSGEAPVVETPEPRPALTGDPADEEGTSR